MSSDGPFGRGVCRPGENEEKAAESKLSKAKKSKKHCKLKCQWLRSHRDARQAVPSSRPKAPLRNATRRGRAGLAHVSCLEICRGMHSSQGSGLPRTSRRTSARPSLSAFRKPVKGAALNGPAHSWQTQKQLLRSYYSIVLSLYCPTAPFYNASAFL